MAKSLINRHVNLTACRLHQCMIHEKNTALAGKMAACCISLMASSLNKAFLQGHSAKASFFKLT